MSLMFNSLQRHQFAVPFVAECVEQSCDDLMVNTHMQQCLCDFACCVLLLTKIKKEWLGKLVVDRGVARSTPPSAVISSASAPLRPWHQIREQMHWCTSYTVGVTFNPLQLLPQTSNCCVRSKRYSLIT